MEYVQGETLEARLRQGPMERAKALSIANEIRSKARVLGLATRRRALSPKSRRASAFSQQAQVTASHSTNARVRSRR